MGGRACTDSVFLTSEYPHSGCELVVVREQEGTKMREDLLCVGSAGNSAHYRIKFC